MFITERGGSIGNRIYRIKEARENIGIIQTELGKMVGVTGSAITNYENETSHPKELKKSDNKKNI